MTRTLQETEKVCSYIRATLEDAINMWMCECNIRRNYSELEHLYTIQEEGLEDEFQLNYGPQDSCFQDDIDPSDEYRSE
jgi:hypothetical protein